MLADLLDGERNFGNEDDMRSTGDSRLDCDPSGVAPHYLHRHHPVMRFSRGMDFVDGISGSLQGRIEPKGDIGGRQIVVDGFWDADELHPFVKKIKSDLLRPVAADGDDGINS